ncbi:hypothetical protein Taro_027865 [Colocasia esculenta]|uniref:Uncharacterized protein n=1 Tax=Colocasia esculenta TaxID=4460 RepID=A0A843VSM7_COLES|nr:hypothetical protein [Colocasia esculenta]
MEGGRGCSSPRSGSSRRWFLAVVVVVLLISVPVIYAVPATSGEELSLGKDCPSLDACRGGVANMGCCTAINDSINKGQCSCVCKQLKIYNHSHLAHDCNARWCIKCRNCRCAMALNGAYTS